MGEMEVEDLSKAIARHESWLERNYYPRNKISIEVSNIRVNSLWVTADITITKDKDTTVYEGSIYPHLLLQRYMNEKGGSNVNQGGSA